MIEIMEQWPRERRGRGKVGMHRPGEWRMQERGEGKERKGGKG